MARRMLEQFLDTKGGLPKKQKDLQAGHILAIQGGSILFFFSMGIEWWVNGKGRKFGRH